MVSRRRESLAGRIDLLIAAMDRLGVRLERASRGPSLATGPVKRMQAASTNEMNTDVAAAIDGDATATRKLYAKALADVPAWKAACKVRHLPKAAVKWLVSSPTGAYWWSLTRNEWRRDDVPNEGAYPSSEFAERALAECTICPPDWEATATPITAPEDVIDPSRAPVAPRGFSMEDVQEHRLCIVPPEKASYIRPTGKRGRYEHVWADGSVTPSAFSDGGLEQCLLSPSWKLVYEPAARDLVGLPALAELDHCREGGAL